MAMMYWNFHKKFLDYILWYLCCFLCVFQSYVSIYCHIIPQNSMLFYFIDFIELFFLNSYCHRVINWPFTNEKSTKTLEVNLSTSRSNIFQWNSANLISNLLTIRINSITLVHFTFLVTCLRSNMIWNKVLFMSVSSHFCNFVFGCFWQQSYQNIM